MTCVFVVFFVIGVSFCEALLELQLSAGSFRQIERSLSSPPDGRKPVVEDIIIRYYTQNVTAPTSRRIDDIELFLTDPGFDTNKPTVIYAHGYVELYTDESVMTVMSAYLRAGGYNVLLLDWSNLAFGNYIIVSESIPKSGYYTGEALLKLLKSGLPLEGLHLVGHSMGCHLMSYAARYLSGRGFLVPRLTGLDPAFPLFYPPIAAKPMAPSDAAFVDVIHTNGGYFGTPFKTGVADFWPNGGLGKQPGCTSLTVPLTNEDFCSHWRSWRYWAESVDKSNTNQQDEFKARKCSNYDAFLKGECEDQAVVLMGLKASPDLRGNYYLRTAARSPFGLGLKGAS